MKKRKMCWYCRRCGARNKFVRPRCRRCRRAESLSYRFAFAKLLLPTG